MGKKLRQGCLRATWHDYRAPGMYMITMLKAATTPVLSTLGVWADSGRVYASPTATGQIVRDVLHNLEAIHLAMHLSNFVIMPDHIHIIIYISERTDRHLGSLLASFKGACSRALWQINPPSAGQPFFDDGFHDRIIIRPGHLATAQRYIADNPRRLYIKRSNPELFCRIHKFTVSYVPDAGNFNLPLEVNDTRHSVSQLGANQTHRRFAQLSAVGNPFLLNDYDIQPVRISRSCSGAALDAEIEKWRRRVQNGTVLVSPFISPGERAVRDMAIAEGGRMIYLQAGAIAERYKPGGVYFDLCNQGRLLVLAPDSLRSSSLGRDTALHLNDLAVAIAQGNIRLRGNFGKMTVKEC